MGWILARQSLASAMSPLRPTSFVQPCPPTPAATGVRLPCNILVCLSLLFSNFHLHLLFHILLLSHLGDLIHCKQLICNINATLFLLQPKIYVPILSIVPVFFIPLQKASLVRDKPFPVLFVCRLRDKALCSKITWITFFLSLCLLHLFQIWSDPFIFICTQFYSSLHLVDFILYIF